MAVLERLDHTRMILDQNEVERKRIEWIEQKAERGIPKLPQIFFANGEPFRAANCYALSKMGGAKGSNIKTVISAMNHIKAYADWLEECDLDWRHFPLKKKDRCLFRFRGYLIEQRKSSRLSPSTVTARMAALIAFYRWTQTYGWVERKELWEDHYKKVRLYATTGFSRTMSVLSSELAIPNRKRHGQSLEDGLTPMKRENQKILLSYLHQSGLIELYLMTLIGCFTGARSETIRTLRLSTLERAVDDPLVPQMKNIAVGPGTDVRTKFDVFGHLLMPTELHEELERYATSARRLHRQARAKGKHQTLLFLTQRGNPYSEATFTKLISDLRERLVKSGLSQFKYFKFHQTRATFGTRLMIIALDLLDSKVHALSFVCDAMLHKSESTTWKYIDFIEKAPVKEKLASEFFNLFTGNTEDTEKLIDQVVYDDAT